MSRMLLRSGRRLRERAPRTRRAPVLLPTPPTPSPPPTPDAVPAMQYPILLMGPNAQPIPVAAHILSLEQLQAIHDIVNGPAVPVDLIASVTESMSSVEDEVYHGEIGSDYEESVYSNLYDDESWRQLNEPDYGPDGNIIHPQFPMLHQSAQGFEILSLSSSTVSLSTVDLAVSSPSVQILSPISPIPQEVISIYSTPDLERQGRELFYSSSEDSQAYLDEFGNGLESNPDAYFNHKVVVKEEIVMPWSYDSEEDSPAIRSFPHNNQENIPPPAQPEEDRDDPVELARRALMEARVERDQREMVLTQLIEDPGLNQERFFDATTEADEAQERLREAQIAYLEARHGFSEERSFEESWELHHEEDLRQQDIYNRDKMRSGNTSSRL